MNKDEHAKGKFMLGFFIGGIVGAIIIVLLGTKEGKKVRHDIEKKGKDAVDDLLEKLDTLQEKGKDIVREGEELKEEMAEHIEEGKEKLTHDATEKLDAALSHIEAIQERGRETTATIRKRFFKNAPHKK